MRLHLPASTQPSTSPISSITPRPQQHRHVNPLPLPPNKKPHLHLGPKGKSLPKVRSAIESQTPHHLRVLVVLGQVVENLVQRGTRLEVPGGDAAVGVGECGEGRGGTEGSEEGEGDAEGVGGEAGEGVEDVGGYGVFFGRG